MSEYLLLQQNDTMNNTCPNWLQVIQTPPTRLNRISRLNLAVLGGMDLLGSIGGYSDDPFNLKVF